MVTLLVVVSLSGCLSSGLTGANSNSKTAASPALSIVTQPSNQTVSTGQPATFQVAASGAAPLAYQWTRNGTVISGATGATYTSPATTMSDSESMFAVIVSNSTGSVASSLATLTVNQALAPLQITTGALPNAQAGIAFQTGLTAVGGVQPYRWSIASGNLPAGVSLNAASGMLSGMAMQGGQVDFAVQVSDSSYPGTQTAMKALNLFVLAFALQINPPAIPNGQVGSPFQASLSGTGGVAPYKWAVKGALPSGLSLSAASGSIAGTPAQAVAPASFTVVLTDSAQQTAQKPVSMTILPAPTQPLSISQTVLAQPVIQQNYSQTLQATGGTPPYAWTVTAGLLPLGISLNSSTGQLSGTPVATGAFSFATTVRDSMAASATAAYSVAVSNTRWNPSALEVLWARDFNSIAANEINVKTDARLSVKAAGDGATDDTSAIRAAIQLASSTGGGVVYLPTGDYKIVASSGIPNGTPIIMPSRVILRGDSSMSSRIFVNDLNAASETDGTWTWGGISFSGASLSGITDLGVFAVNSSASSCALLWNRGSTNVSELVFNNLDVHLANCRTFWFEGTNKLLVQGSNFDSTNTQNAGNASQYGPIYIAGNSNLTFQNNAITYHFGRIHIVNDTNVNFQGNTMTRDAMNLDMDNGTAVESGGVEISFDQNIQMLNNTIQTLNAPAGEAGDGEAITSQQATVANVQDAGSVTAISSTTLTDTNSLWGPVTASRLAQFPEVVAILTGSGTGEWLPIASVNTSTQTLTLGQPWNIVPEVGSLYSIFEWTLMNATIQGNTLIGNPNGIVIYDGCYGCTIKGNILNNSREIILRTVDESLDPSVFPEGRRIHEVAMNVSILNNTVSNTAGTRPAYVALDVEAFQPASYSGMGMMNIQMGGNTINVYSANPSLSYANPVQTEVTQEGFFPCFMYGPAKVKAPVTTVFQDIYFWNNTLSATVTYPPAFLPLTTQACVTSSAPSAQ